MCGIRGEKHAGDGLSNQEHTPNSRHFKVSQTGLNEGQKQNSQKLSLPLRAKDMEVVNWAREPKKLADAAEKADGGRDDGILPFSMPDLEEVKSGNITTPSNVRRGWRKGGKIVPLEFFTPEMYSPRVAVG